MEINMPFGCATVSLVASPTSKMDRYDSTHVLHELTDTDAALQDMYKHIPNYSVRVRVEFQPEATDAERKLISELLVQEMGEKVAKVSQQGKGYLMYSYPYDEAKRLNGYDFNNTTLLDKPQAKDFARRAAEAVRSARQRWWATDLGSQHTDAKLKVVSAVLDGLMEGLSPVKAAKVEELLQDGIGRVEHKLRGVDVKKRGAALAYHMESDKGISAQLGAVGISEELARKMYADVGERLYGSMA